MKFLRLAIFAVLAIAAAASLWLLWNYHRHDLEKSVITESVRQSVGSQFVSTPLGVVHYQLGGHSGGRTAVLIHGFSVPYYLWDPTFDALVAAGFRTIRYDLFGRGFSDRPAVAYDANLYDRQLEELLYALHITEPVDLLGASMGGPIAATFACRHPEQVRSLAFFDPGYSQGQEMPFKIRAPLLGEYEMTVEIAPHLPQAQMSDFLHPERFPGWTDRYLPQMRYQGFRRALLSTLRNYLTIDWSKDFVCVGASRKPVFLVWGKADRDVPFELSRQVLGVIPSAQFLAIEDAAHVPFLEHPEKVNPALLAFLYEH